MPAADPEPPPSEPAPQAAPQPLSPPEPGGPVTIAAVGDLMLGTDYPQDILPDDDGVSFLAPVAPLLQAADVAFGKIGRASCRERV